MFYSNMSYKLLSILSITFLCACWAVPARADYAVLDNGFQLRVDRRENQGSLVRLFITGGGYVDVESSQLRSYEVEEVPPPAPPPAPAVTTSDLLATAGYRHGLDPVLLHSVIAEESNFNARAVSPKGARGLMQLMPGTAQLLGVKDAFSASENVQGGALYLRTLLERYKGDLAKALAAYNAGPAKVDRYRGVPPYAETQNYVRRVITRFNQEKVHTALSAEVLRTP